MLVPLSPPTAVIIIVAVILGFWLIAQAWPAYLTWRIRGTGSASRDVRSLLLFILLATVILYYALLQSSKSDWLAPEPAITAFLLVGGILFTYRQFFPPNFVAGFWPVTDSQKGTFDDSRPRLTLEVAENAWTPVFVAIYNTGITNWGTYRITVHVPGCEVADTRPEFPESGKWDWRTSEIRVNPSVGSLQILRSASLTVAEPQTFRFFVKAPTGVVSVQTFVSVVADGKVSQETKALELLVKKVGTGIESPASQSTPDSSEP